MLALEPLRPRSWGGSTDLDGSAALLDLAPSHGGGERLNGITEAPLSSRFRSPSDELVS